MTKKILHLHIPKSAGSTFNKCLEYYFPGKVYRVKGHFNYSYPIPLIGDELAIAGHFDMKSIIELFPDPSSIQIICFLRNPYERVLSGYYNIIRDVTNPSYEQVKHMDLLSYVESDLVPDTDNGQVRRLSSIGVRMGDSRPVTSTHLEEAFNLINKYKIQIGISEKFESSILKIASALKWRLPRYITVNKSKNRKRGVDLPYSKKVYQAIAQRNIYDLALYQYFYGLHVLASDPPYFMRWKFRVMNKLYLWSKVPAMVRFKYQSLRLKR